VLLRKLARVRILASRLFLLAAASLFVFTHSAWTDRAPLLTVAMLIAGLILAAVATAGRLWCSLYIAGYKNSRLVMVGPYSVCRNPLYLFSFLGVMGVALASATLTIPAALAVGFAFYYRAVIAQEEEYLSKRYGAEFDAYRARVPAFWPKLSLLQEPPTYDVNPIVFRKHLGSAIWFPPAVGLLLLLKLLQNHLPNWFQLY